MEEKVKNGKTPALFLTIKKTKKKNRGKNFNRNIYTTLVFGTTKFVFCLKRIFILGFSRHDIIFKTISIFLSYSYIFEMFYFS